MQAIPLAFPFPGDSPDKPAQELVTILNREDDHGLSAGWQVSMFLGNGTHMSHEVQEIGKEGREQLTSQEFSRWLDAEVMCKGKSVSPNYATACGQTGIWNALSMGLSVQQGATANHEQLEYLLRAPNLQRSVASSSLSNFGG